jgi:hypothetical protein
MIGGKEFTFGVSGKLHFNSLIMYDHQTQSLWSHLLGKAVRGVSIGKRLTALPSLQTTWQNWKTLHPKTLVLSRKRWGILSYSRDVYDSYYASGQTGIVPVKRRDSRVSPKAYVIGLRLNKAVKAYPFPELSRTPVVNDTVGGAPVVVTFLKAVASGAVFDRRLNGTLLTFEDVKGEGPAGLLLRDKETASTWNPLSGKAISGKSNGRQLKQIPTTYAFWFGWIDHYPDTLIYRVAKN